MIFTRGVDPGRRGGDGPRQSAEKPVPLCPGVEDKSGKPNLLPTLFLFLVAFAAFSPVLTHPFLDSWDDTIAIVANPAYNPPRWTSLAHYWTQPPAKGLFYVPITYTLWGLLAFVERGFAPAGSPLRPALFYGANLIAHATSTALVYLILCHLFRLRRAAWIGAGLFALHPIQVEAVANAWDLYTPLSAAFGFVAIWRYLIFSGQAESDDRVERSRVTWNYAFAAVAFLCALLSKPTAAIVPLMIAAIELGLNRRSLHRVALRLGPWLAAALVVTWINQRTPAAGRVYLPDAWLRPLVPLDAISFYLGKVLLPLGFCMDYGRTPWAVAGKPAVRITCLIALGLISAAFALRRRWPIEVTAFAVFVAGLLPSLGLVPFTFQYYSTVADRYAYLAMLGPAIAVAALIWRYPTKWSVSVASASLTLLAVLSVFQMRHWEDDWKLAAYTLEVNPRSAAAGGTFQYLLGSEARSEPGSGIGPPRPRCTLSSRELALAADRLTAGGFPDLGAQCRRLAIGKAP